MFQFFLTAYPWDLVHDELEGVLDRLHGEIGVTGLSVWVGVPPVSQFRVREVKPRVFRTRGGLFFHPDGERYGSTRCKPMTSEWLKSRRPLQRLSDACQDRGMTLRAIVSASRTGRLIDRHPEMACKNAFGDESQSSLCLANPDVRAYLCCLVSELSARDGVSGVTIADFALSWTDTWATTMNLPAALGSTELKLLSLCFCESCQQGAAGADVDVRMAQRSVQAILERSLENGSPRDLELESILADNRPLADFDRWRSMVLSSLLESLVGACGCGLLLDRSESTRSSEWRTKQNWDLPAAVITRLDNPEGVAGALCQRARRNELRLPGLLALEPHAPDLVRIMSQAVEFGFSAIDMSDYGLLPDKALIPIKQAIRFAKRSAGD